jgi:dTDP-4-dehydrorhamnose reductase
MKIILIGASSYVGSRIFYDLKDKYQIVGTCHKLCLSKKQIKLNITNQANVFSVIEKVKPEVIIHVANFPSPSSISGNEDFFEKVNKQATEYIVNAANKLGAKVIFISSQAANNPSNLYGKLKAESEGIVKKTKTGYAIIRPSIIYGFSPNTFNPRPFNRILSCLDNNMVGEFDTSWKLQPTYLGNISQVIDKVISFNLWNKTIPLFINELTTQYSVAKDILNQFGLKTKSIDKKLNIPQSKDSLEIFNSFNLTPKTYKQFIQVLVEEIKERSKFVFE